MSGRWPFRLLRRKAAPEPPDDLTPYQGYWVAVRDGKLLGYAPSASEMMHIVLLQKGAWNGCTIWFEERPEDVQRWSVQYASRPGWVFPNCLFSTREGAEHWLRGWPGAEGDEGAVFTRDGQHDPWRSAPEKTVTTDA